MKTLLPQLLAASVAAMPTGFIADTLSHSHAVGALAGAVAFAAAFLVARKTMK